MTFITGILVCAPTGTHVPIPTCVCYVCTCTQTYIDVYIPHHFPMEITRLSLASLCVRHSQEGTEGQPAPALPLQRAHFTSTPGPWGLATLCLPLTFISDLWTSGSREGMTAPGWHEICALFFCRMFCLQSCFTEASPGGAANFLCGVLSGSLILTPACRARDQADRGQSQGRQEGWHLLSDTQTHTCTCTLTLGHDYQHTFTHRHTNTHTLDKHKDGSCLLGLRAQHWYTAIQILNIRSYYKHRQAPGKHTITLLYFLEIHSVWKCCASAPDDSGNGHCFRNQERLNGRRA